MKMAEYDAQRREAKACVRNIRLLESTIEYVVNKGGLPPNFSELQFQMFDTVRDKFQSYVDCREIVEWTSQLLFAFEDVKVDVALKCLLILRESMFNDESPLSITNQIFILLLTTVDKYSAERIIASVTNFLQQYIDSTLDNIVYL